MEGDYPPPFLNHKAKKMSKKELVNIVTNSVVLSHALSDCLAIMIDKGYLFHSLKQAGKRYEKLIERNNNRIFSGLSDERAEKVSKEIDQMNEIFSKISRLSFEDKGEVLDYLSKKY